MSTELKEQVQNAITADDLKCGHKGKCSTCKTCKAFNDDGFPQVKVGKKEDETKEVNINCSCFLI